MENPTQNDTDHAPLTFTYPLILKITAAACMLLFGYSGMVNLLFFGGLKRNLAMVVFSSAIALVGLMVFLRLNRRWMIQRDGVLTRSWNGHEEIHYWTDMSTIDFAEWGVDIKDEFGKTTLSLNSRIENLGLFLDALRQRKKELFKVAVIKFRNGPLLPILFGVFFLAVLAYAIYCYFSDQLLSTILAIPFLLVFLYKGLRTPSSLYLERKTLRLKYPWGERTLSAGEILRVYIHSSYDQHFGTSTSAILELENEKKISLPGAEVTVRVLQSWLDDCSSVDGKAEVTDARFSWNR